MKEYRIYKDIGEIIPSNFIGIYYDPGLKYFLRYACSVITDRNNYRIEGPDETIKKKLKK